MQAAANLAGRQKAAHPPDASAGAKGSLRLLICELGGRRRRASMASHPLQPAAPERATASECNRAPRRCNRGPVRLVLQQS